MKIVFALMLLSTAARAQGSDVFAPCASAPNLSIQLTCKNEVVDELIEKHLGKAKLAKATSGAKASCASVHAGVKLDPELRRLASLQCKLQYKIEFYNNHP